MIYKNIMNVLFPKDFLKTIYFFKKSSILNIKKNINYMHIIT